MRDPRVFVRDGVFVADLFDPLDPGDERPPSVQIADRIRAAVQDGRLAQGRPLPGTSQIARYYRVSDKTVARAVRLLADQGVVRSHPGRGSFACGPPGGRGG
jgi:DNA-binding GntR family transcriptional regulator